VNQDSTWSQQSVIDWYGPGQRPHYGAVLASGRNSDVDAGERFRPMLDAHWQACAANPASAAERKAEQSVA
jgi:hypothetical protein